jgi:hypothetical protein
VKHSGQRGGLHSRRPCSPCCQVRSASKFAGYAISRPALVVRQPTGVAAWCLAALADFSKPGKVRSLFHHFLDALTSTRLPAGFTTRGECRAVTAEPRNGPRRKIRKTSMGLLRKSWPIAGAMRGVKPRRAARQVYTEQRACRRRLHVLSQVNSDGAEIVPPVVEGGGNKRRLRRINTSPSVSVAQPDRRCPNEL